MKKRLLAAAIAAAFTLTFGATAFAGEVSETDQLREEIAKLSAKLAQLETKQNATAAKVNAPAPKPNVNFFFDNRIEYTHNTLNPNSINGALGGALTGTDGKVTDKDQFMERIRIYMNAKIGDSWEWNARAVQAKWNINKTEKDNTGGEFKFDRFWVTNNNLLGGKVEMGKMALYPGKGAFFGNTGDTEGLFYTKTMDRLTMKLGNARAGGQDVSFVEAIYKPTKTSDIGAYTLQTDLGVLGKDIDMTVVNGAFEIPHTDGLALSFEYAKSHADDIPSLLYKGKQSGYFVALQSKYVATNYMPALYTNMVNPFKKKDHGWGISYRHMPAGVSGWQNRGSFSWVPLTTDTSGTWQNTYNDINAWRFDYVYVPWKNVQWTLTYDRIKSIDGTWKNNSIQSTFNFFF
jgi:outer membrane murein-binding lipoprotein Lpp